MKHCPSCSRDLPVDAFGVHTSKRDGRRSHCLECSRNRRAANRDRVLEVQRRSAAKARANGYRPKPDTIEKWHHRNPLAHAAHVALHSAVRAGRVVKPARCGCGGDGRVVAHHDDYAEPLVVQWVCDVCHRRIHDELKAAGLEVARPRTGGRKARTAHGTSA